MSAVYPFSIPLTVVLLALVIATITDLGAFRIHNLLTLPLAASGVAYHLVTGGPDGLAQSSLGLFVGFGVFFALYLVGGIGGGDVKLMAGIGAWVGAPAVVAVSLAAALAAGAYSLAVVAACGRGCETWMRLQLIAHRAAAVGRHLAAEDRVEDVVADPDRRARLVPFGGMVGIGLLALILMARLSTRH